MGVIHSEATDELFEAMLSLKSVDEFYSFFDDICTIREVLDITQRLQVAKMLSNNKNYQDIAAEIGVSTATISRVNRCLVYGSGGYKLVLDREKGKENESE